MLIEALPAFSAYLATTCAKATRYSYTSRARSYLRTLQGDAQFTTANVRAYLRALGDAHRPATVHSALAAIHKFGAFLLEQKLLPANPADGIRSPRPDRPLRETPAETEVTALMDACERIRHPYRRSLARAVVYTLVMSALRRSELLALSLTDVDLDAGTLYVRHGKGDRARVVSPGPACIEALRAYQALRPPCPRDRLFLLRKGFVLGDQGLRVLLRDLFAIAGCPGCRALLPHGLRHACATRLRAKNVELEEIKEFLGHSDVNTTILYLHRPAERARQIAELTDPRTSVQSPVLTPPTGSQAAPASGPAPVEPPDRVAQSGNERPPWLHVIDGTGGGGQT
jgi:site-specific recombinase XerD